MCDSCFEEWLSWLDYRLVHPVRFCSNASRDDTAEGLRDRKRANLEEWRRTIRTQRQLIREACARLHSREPDVVVVPTRCGDQFVLPLEVAS